MSYIQLKCGTDLRTDLLSPAFQTQGLSGFSVQWTSKEEIHPVPRSKSKQSRGVRGSSKRGCTGAAGKRKVETKRQKIRDDGLTAGTTTVLPG